MKLIFAFNNLTTNTLLGFLKQDFIESFVDYKSNDGFTTRENIDSDIEIYGSLLSGLENEILQVIETTNQETIDDFFKSLIGRIQLINDRFKEEAITKAYLSHDKEGKHIKEYVNLVSEQHERFSSLTKKYINDFIAGKIKSKHKENQVNKPVLFVEGDNDIKYINKAAELLGQMELLSKIEIRQRGGHRNLDRLWDLLKDTSWETVPQVKIFLYDCDTQRADEDNGLMFRRRIPQIPERKIDKGIENLFDNAFIEKAEAKNNKLIDFRKEHGRERGQEYDKISFSINKDEKTNFCEWACANGGKDDFKDFSIIFKIIQAIVN